MKKILLAALFVAAALFTNQLNAQCTDLFFSEYIEGSSNNKAIEIYNPTNAKIGLDNYEVRLYSNGSSSAGTTLAFASTDSIGAYDVYVITNGSASLTGITSNSDVTSGVINYNGDDAIELYKISTTSSIDIIGAIGTRSNWSVTGTNSTSGSTKDNTIVRDPSIQQGQTNWTIGATEWMVFAQDMDDSLGTHIAACPVVVSPTTSFSVTNTTCNAGVDGAIDLTVTGGTAPYTYLWSNAATTEDLTGLAAATYTVTITDAASATKVDSAIVTEPAGMTINISVLNPVSCDGNNDGILKTNVSGGAGGYTYLWSNAITTSTNLNVGSGTYTVTVTDANSCTNTATYVLTAPAAIVITSAITNVSGNGLSDGSIDVSTTNGVSPLTYSWSNAATTEDISGLMAGTYSITVSDAGSCSSTQSFTITEPALFTTFVSTQANNACNGAAFGSLTVASSGGVSPYSYSWSNAAITATISNLTAGTYTVTATDANSITSTATATITEPTAITPLSSITNVTANGGSNGAIDLTVSGGTAPYTYAWSNAATTEDITGLTAGTYVVTISDAFTCSTTLSNVVTQPTSINLSSTKVDVLCNGASTGSIDLTVSGGTAPYTYAWSNSAITEDISGLAATTYTVTVTDASSVTATNSVVISEPTALVSSIVVDSNVTCNGLSNGGLTASATGGTSTYTYSWSNSATTPSITGVSVGTYTVTISDANSCTSVVSGTITEPSTLSLSNVATNVTTNGGTDGAIDLTVSGGTNPYTFNWSNAATTEDITNLTAGTYSVTVTDINLCSATASVVITQPAGALASLIITEISYNGPESGTDTTEFIEFQNVGSTAVNLTGYTFSQGVNHTFTGGLVAPGDYFVIAYDSSAFRNTYGLDADDIWTSGGLSNGGEDITIVDNFGRTVDSVNFDDGGAWPSGSGAGQADGGGASIILCDSTLDNNLGTSWNAAISPVVGQIVNGFQIFANPGTGGVCSLPMSIVMVNDSNVTCNAGMNGGASVTVTGGLSPITYSWSNTATTASITGIAAGTYTVTVTDGLNATLVDSVVITEPTAIVVTDVVTNASANGLNDGAINITVSGGTSPYTYLWSNAATTEDLTAIGAGSYSVTITDGNMCTSVNMYAVTQPTSIAIVDTIMNVSCNSGTDGSIALTIAGGVSPYTYLWSNADTTATISNLSAGTYNVTVTDANSITATGAYVVTEPTSIQITGTATAATTFGGADGSIDISVSGGTPGYAFLWSTAATTEDIASLATGTYTVTVSDTNSCTAVDSFVVTQPAGPLASLTITEINYNGPEAGVDSTEFIEFVNTGSSPVDLTGYSFVEGVTHSFTSGSIAAGQYMVIAFDSSGFRNTFGFNADFIWNSGGLSNGGEDITLVDNFNRTVDSVDFDDAAPWPLGFGAGQPDGGGASLVLCDSTADNNVGSNWFAATSPVAGQIINGLQVFANPGIGAPCIVSLAAAIIVDSNVSCSGLSDGGLTVNVASGSTPISYVWSNAATTASITGLVAGTYTVTITDGNSATLVDSAIITEPAPISFTTVIVDQTSLGNDGSIDLTVSGGTPGYTFLWSTTDTTEDISGLNAGVYTVTITDTNNCVFTDSVTVGLSIGIQEATLQNNLLIYPNPSNGIFTIETIAQYDEIKILDITGKVVFMTEEYTLRNEIDLTSQQRGIYFISIQGESGRVVKKVIVN